MNSNFETRNANRNFHHERTQGTQKLLPLRPRPLRIGWGEGLRVRCDPFSASDGEKVAKGRMRCPALSLLALLTSVLCLLPSVHAATFTTGFTITETNFAYDGQDITISGATVAIDGAHGFNSLLLTNGAVLTHSACTTTNTHMLDLTISNDITVSTNSRIDVSGKGYLVGRTSGNNTNGASTGMSGGSYGGLGGNHSGTANATYGDYAVPDNWGSGGGTQNIGSGGGGRVAVYAGDYSAFNLGSITAGGGAEGQPGGAGTVYLRDTDEPKGVLVIDGAGSGGGWTALGMVGTNSFTLPVDLVIRGGNARVRPAHDALALHFTGSLRIENGARLSSIGALDFGGGLMLTSGGMVEGAAQVTWQGPLVLDGVTLMADRVEGPELVLTNGGVLTCTNSTATQMHKLEVDIAGTITVSTNSQIDVSGKGYLAGRTTGNTTNGGTTGWAGGSHGGLGVAGELPSTAGIPNAVYDDLFDPSDWGSGGGTAGANGGGLVRLVAGSLHLEGQLLAKGLTGIQGGGAGGSIYVAVGTLQGSGLIRAAGAYQGPDGGGGGGGRVAIYAADFSNFNTNAITAPGTDGSGAGTIYLRDTNLSSGVLVIDNTSSPGGPGWTPLGLPGSNVFYMAEPIIIRGNLTRVRPEHSGMVLEFQHPLTVDGATLAGGRILAPSLTLSNGGIVSSLASSASQMHKLELEVSGTINVQTNSRIDVSSQGYLARRTTGNTPVGGATGQSAGGSYGGLGGAAVGTVNAVYGDYADPDDWGSGSTEVPGGGLVRLRAGTLQLNGEVRADCPGACIAGGSGGGIFIEVGSIAGQGSIRAAGSGAGCTVPRSSGGGGRIAIYAQDFSGFNTNRITAPGGGDGAQGGAGTVHLLQGRPHTHVRSFQPKGLNGGLVGNELPAITNRTGYVSNAFDHVTLEFNKPINTNSYDISKLLIDGPSAPITPGGFVEVSNRTYQVPLALQTVNGIYHFTLLPTLLDTEGFPLDQNANGIPGEGLDDVYTFTLILDTVPPRITQHAPLGDVAGTITNVDLWFSEVIDKTTFTAADVAMTNPTNGIINVTSITNFGLNRYRVRFAPQRWWANIMSSLAPTSLTSRAIPLPQPSPIRWARESPTMLPSIWFQSISNSLVSRWARINFGPAIPSALRGRAATTPALRSWATGLTQSISRLIHSGTSRILCLARFNTPAGWRRTRFIPRR